MLDNAPNTPSASPSTPDACPPSNSGAQASSFSLVVERRFSLVVTEYEWRDVTVDFSTGAKLSCRVPKAWSDNAAATLMSKYAVRAGVPNSMGGVNGREVDAERIFDRLVAGWRAAAVDHGYWSSMSTLDDAEAEDHEHLDSFCAEIKAMLEQQVAAPNSPQWFNTGVAVQYGVTAGSDGHYSATVDHLGNAHAHECSDSLADPQISACFIQSVSDNLVSDGGIMDLWRREARLFKYGSGSGANYSALRGKGEPLSRGGASSGLLSFLRVGDRSAGAIKSGGTTRRSARMVIVDVDHPDIEDFIDWKSREDDKIRALHAAGFGDASSFEDEATDTVSGQNANNSVAVTDEFMRAAINGEPWALKWRTDPNATRIVDAADLWRSIAEAAWKCADPGLQFADTINRWHTCKADGPIRGSNPCQPAFAPVLTPDGIRTMGDIEVGDIVWSGKQWTAVKRKIATGVKSVHVYHTTAGRVISTAEHQVFQHGERVPAAQAEAIDIAFGPATDATLTEPTDPQDVMDGLYFGDGSYRGDATEGQRCMLAIGENDGCYHTSEVRHLIKRAQPGYNYCSWSVQSTLEQLPHTYERVIPEQFYQGDTRRIRGFLRGLYSANGSVVGRDKRGRVTLKATSFAVISAVQDMLSVLGIRSYYTTNRANEVEFANGTYLCKQSYDLNITVDAERFAQLIGFLHPHKCERLIDVVEGRRQVGEHKYASGKPKTCYEVREVEHLGELPVYDIEVEADEHSYWSGGHLISNCSEYVFLDDTACNLASINLAKFYVAAESNLDCSECRGRGGSYEPSIAHTDHWAPCGACSRRPKAHFDFAAYEHAVRLWTIVLDVSVSMAGYPTAEIARRSMLYRTLGLGYAGLGELLVLLGLGYGQPRGRAFAAQLTSTLTRVAYSTSVELARKLGAFPRFGANRQSVHDVLLQHRHATIYGNDAVVHGEPEKWAELIADARRYGVRNAQVTLLAPCGTIGIVMGCETTGVEPYYSDTTFKKLAGGGYMRLAYKRFAETLAAYGYDVDDCTRRTWTVENGGVLEYVWVEPPADLADVLVCASDLTPTQHVDMMAAVQPFLSGAISKTVNMPSDATVDDIEAMYLYAWKSGLKSVAIYRDGCKPAQPLQGRKPAPGVQTYPTRESAEAFAAAAFAKTTPFQLDEVTLASERTTYQPAGSQPQPTIAADPPRRGERVEPPPTANAVKHRVELSGHTFYLILTEHDDGSLAEVFVTCSRTGSAISGWVNAWAKQCSLALQHGTPLDVLVAAMQGESFEPGGYHEGRPALSPVDCFARIIEARYLARNIDPADVRAVVNGTQVEGAVRPDYPRELTLPEVLAGAERASARVQAWPDWKPTGQLCDRCGSADLRRSGTCFVCGACGSTTGCS